MKNILLSGGTGFIGTKLVSHLLKAFSDVHITVLIRDEKDQRQESRVRYCLWNVQDEFISPDVLQDIDTVIHLAGASIAEKRWTADRKKVLLESRTKSTQLLVDWITTRGSQVKTFVSASAMGWYGAATGKIPFVEQDPAGDDFLAHVCAEWEAAAKPLRRTDVRTVWIRTGLVLHPDGGMWKEMKKAFAFRVAPRFGHGKQVFSWIGLDDLLRMYTFAAVTTSITGPINAVAPYPEQQAILTRKLLKKSSGITIGLPIPAFALKIGLGELSQELLKSAPVSSKKVEDAGFTFLQPRLEDL
ncbi:TIGR01777 family oxidoreductase [Sphingobacterium sp. lm-10]|uniref:TIGR01777 family oxidoreductase n=1 Tax=Sphingobacterium sp. lm-10 TaxID=2944904 RepID=UPI0020210248|nr:TIGR01777 family oxidoreductase [Sphingobacterium sp. lm-10]MCL7987798.1 TIGR01777 family oxidoreductase [Sphingobacterium sp. lm-10]